MGRSPSNGASGLSTRADRCHQGDMHRHRLFSPVRARCTRTCPWTMRPGRVPAVTV